MQIKIKDVVSLLLCLSLFIFGIAQAQDNNENKLVEFKGLGEWEIWCLDIKQSGTVECNLNHVLRYKDHPDFRAMIFRFYSDGNQVTRLVIDHEWQTSFLRGFFQVDDYEQIDLSDCGTQCRLTGERLIKVINQFSSANKATIQFHDYLVQEFVKIISVDSFAEAVQSLHKMQKRFLD